MTSEASQSQNCTKSSYKKSIDIFTRLQNENTKGHLQTDIAFFNVIAFPFLAWEELVVTHFVDPSSTNPPHEALRLAEDRRARALGGLLAKEVGLLDKPLTVKQMQEIAMQHHTTFLLYSCSMTKETKAWVWVIPPRGEVTHRLLDLTPMQQEMKIKDNRPGHLQTVRGNREPALLEVASWVKRSPWVPSEAEVLEGSKVMRLWYTCLIAPIKDKLPKGNGARLTIVPDTRFGDLPFSLFQEKTGKSLLECYLDFVQNDS